MKRATTQIGKLFPLLVLLLLGCTGFKKNRIATSLERIKLIEIREFENKKPDKSVIRALSREIKILIRYGQPEEFKAFLLDENPFVRTAGFMGLAYETIPLSINSAPVFEPEFPLRQKEFDSISLRKMDLETLGEIILETYFHIQEHPDF